MADLARTVPGFSFTQSDVNVPVYTLRGVGFNETSLAAIPAVSVYVDEVALPYPAMTAGPQFDLERVEVVTGPQGTLYGQNATGGAINYIARKPGRRFEAGATLDYGRFDRINGKVYAGGTLGLMLAMRVAVRAKRGGSWQRSQTRDDRLGSVDRLGGAFPARLAASRHRPRYLGRQQPASHDRAISCQPRQPDSRRLPNRS